MRQRNSGKLRNSEMLRARLQYTPFNHQPLAQTDIVWTM